MKAASPWLVIGVLLCAMGHSALSAQPAKPAPEPASTLPTPTAANRTARAPIDPFAITVEGDPGNRVGQVVYVTVSVKNVSSDTVRISNMTVELDDAMKDRFEPNQTCNQQQFGEILMAKDMAVLQSCRFKMKPSQPWGSFGPDNSLLAATVRLAVKVQVRGEDSYAYFPVFNVKAPEISVFIGGVAGALMLAIFVLVEKILRNAEARDRWVRTLLVTLMMGFRGGLMAIIALLLSKTTQSAASPVSLTVVDFAGGVLVGLFSYPLATWISATLKIDTPALAKSAAANATGI